MGEGLVRWREKQELSDMRFIEAQMELVTNDKVERICNRVSPPYHAFRYFFTRGYKPTYKIIGNYCQVSLTDDWNETFILIVKAEDGFRTGFILYKEHKGTMPF